MKGKIFVIGFQKTGTTSLELALEELGYSVCGYRTHLYKPLKKGNWQPVYEVVDRYDAFQDTPWPVLYKQLDQQYPGSKFILTYRDDDRWI